MKKIFILLILYICSGFYSTDISAQPLRTVHAFFQSKSFGESKKYVCCKMLEEGYYEPDFKRAVIGIPEWHQRPLNPGKHEQLSYSGTAAFYKTTFKYPEDTIDYKEFYTYLVKGKEGWKIEDYKVRNIHVKEKEVQVLQLSLSDERDSARFERLKLFLSDSTELADYFINNKEKFLTLLQSADSLSVFPYSELSQYDRAKKIKPWLPPLLLSGVHKEYYSFFVVSESPVYKDAIFFEIEHYDGEMNGYLYTEDASEIIADNKTFISVQSLGKGWYIYKALHR